MSGGSYDYAYRTIADLADEIRPTSTLRKLFAAHLKRVASACRDIEWVDSGDYARGVEDEAIKKCLGECADKLVLAWTIEDARLIIHELQAAIAKATETLANELEQKGE